MHDIMMIPTQQATHHPHIVPRIYRAMPLR
jgi:hypothetical protein